MRKRLDTDEDNPFKVRLNSINEELYYILCPTAKGL